MNRQMTENEALVRAASYCSASEHCREEINEKLRRWGIAPDVAERIMDRLEAEKYIDDERFCRAYVNDKFRFSKWGKKKIAQGLYQKKIPAEAVCRYLDEIDDEHYLSVLRELLRAKRKSVRAENEYERNAKLARFAMSRGFEWEYIRLCIDLNEED
ncbi:regulatory protein RecX [Bacteroides pyogenes]|uniref:regulatory protein RecX n=1 Tax=Bacteroides pyogenes TaxID=310300 RepID=UPI0011E42C0C|nr:regulatory protein RecX [Bacteroides pyogenes]MBR8708432.1 Regulatory protein RecX [Bacteroides pyogenes]MBR8717028.1 Regulatory protein RecX [Bacteroides pyogenes]MBR8746803.1 Regulatory protein RecX [Bacteroides pyogenes]MBR8757030.1 Regulatory protein RecX [Bacteroides pyogenes]MBR8780301.1 Regulatory protein RecX [Bacteroides pyogenes]